MKFKTQVLINGTPRLVEWCSPDKQTREHAMSVCLDDSWHRLTGQLWARVSNGELTVARVYPVQS